MIYLFADCALDTDRRELRRASEPIEIEPQVFDLLELLVRSHNRVISRDDMLEVVWQGRIVSESTLSSRINAARNAIGDDGTAQRLIRTLPRKGFRFVGEVRQQHDVAPLLPAAPPPPEISTDGAPAVAFVRNPSIAVLPFTNLSGDASDDQVGQGLADDIITALWRFGGLDVIARTSSFKYDGQAVDIREVGRDLGADYVLEGSIRRHKGVLRVAAQLIESSSGTHLWAERFDASVDEVFNVQDRIAESTVAIIEPIVRFAEAEQARRAVQQAPTAYDLRMQALSLSTEFTADSMSAALQCLDRALKIDPTYAIAMAASAFYESQCRIQGWDQATGERTPDSAKRAWNALKLAKDDPIVLWMAAFAVWNLDRDARQARNLFQQSLSINSTSPIALALAGLHASTNGDPSGGRQMIERARRLNPRPPREWLNLTAMAVACVCDQNFAEAIGWAERALVQCPRHALALMTLAVGLVETGEADRAEEAARRLLLVDPQRRVSTLAERLPPMDGRVLVAYHDGLRKARLPE